jgi:hypothetical protein
MQWARWPTASLFWHAPPMRPSRAKFRSYMNKMHRSSAPNRPLWVGKAMD